MKHQTLAILAAFLFIPTAAQAAETAETAQPEENGSIRTEPGTGVGDTTNSQKGIVHTVVKGDTLWDLTEKYLGNPWYWPKVWSYNQHIENPHWIYPGNTIRFDAPPAAGANSNSSNAAAADMPAQLRVTQPESEESALDDEIREYMDDELVTVSEGKSIGLVPENAGSGVRQESFISVEEFKTSGKLDSAFSEKRLLSVYDKVYLAFDDPLAVRLGDLYTIYRPGDEIIHPSSGDSYGYQINVVGTVRITALHSDHVTGIIESAADEIRRGDLVSVFSETEKKLTQTPNEQEVRGAILASLNPLLPLLGEQHLVFIDKGTNDGVKNGNTFDIIRAGDPLTDTTEGNESEVYPEESVGAIVVIDAKETASVGVIVRSLQEISVGETVVMRVPKNGAQR